MPSLRSHYDAAAAAAKQRIKEAQERDMQQVRDENPGVPDDQLFMMDGGGEGRTIPELIGQGISYHHDVSGKFIRNVHDDVVNQFKLSAKLMFAAMGLAADRAEQRAAELLNQVMTMPSPLSTEPPPGMVHGRPANSQPTQRPKGAMDLGEEPDWSSLGREFGLEDTGTPGREVIRGDYSDPFFDDKRRPRRLQ